MNETETAEDDPRRSVTAPPYIPFGTLLNLLRRMKQDGHPDLVDRSYLTGMSGGYQSQVIAALKAFRLIERDGKPAPDLERLLNAEEEDWPTMLREQIALLYAAPLNLANRNATQGQLEKLFRDQYGFSGSTLRKAIKFYLDASRFAGLPVSPLWRAPSRPPRGGKASMKATGRARKRVPSAKKRLRSGVESERDVSTGSRTQVIELASGGKVTLGIAVDLFALSESDRQFVFDLVDRVRTYGQTGRE